jgi:hypothetical protein
MSDRDVLQSASLAVNQGGSTEPAEQWRLLVLLVPWHTQDGGQIVVASQEQAKTCLLS